MYHRVASLAVYISGVSRMPGAHWRVDLRARIKVYILISACVGLVWGSASILGSEPATPRPAARTEQLLPDVSNPPHTQELHDLAIAAVDLDPEFDAQKAFTGRPYNLLVAVENKGNRIEGPFTVSLQLLTQDRGQLVMAAHRTLQMLSAGDVTVVRFPGQTPTPARGVYLLSTQVETLLHDANITNNRRTLEIRMNYSN
jgi:hypothetical protein